MDLSKGAAATQDISMKRSIELINNLFLFQDSAILSNDMKDMEFYKLLPPNVKHTKKLYSLSQDGASSKVFHDKCDHQNPTLILVRANKDFVFGYYTTIPFHKDEKYNTCDDCFIFSLRNPIHKKILKFPIRADKKFIAVYQSSKSPCFGSTLQNKQDLWLQ